jgi:hypothetical protein
VAEALIQITERGQQKLYNLAAGVNVTHQNIADILKAEGYSASFKPGGVEFTIPEIDNSRLVAEFDLKFSDPQISIMRVLRQLKLRGRTQ